MNPINIAVQVLNDEFNIFSFLPVINYSYIYIQEPAPGLRITIITGLTFFVSAILFNFLSEVELFIQEEVDTHKESDSVDTRAVVAFVLIIAAWFPLLICGLVHIYSMFGGDTLWPEALMGTSILFLSLLASDLLLNKTISSHGNDEQE